MIEEEFDESNASRGEMSRALAQVQRLIARQNFESEEQIETYLQSMVDSEAEGYEVLDLTNAEKAEDIVFEAMDCEEESDAIKLLNDALVLDPECMIALEEMAMNVETIEEEQEWLERAVQIGRQRFGGTFMQEHGGDFWSHPETHSYLRCLDDLATVMDENDKLDQAVALLEELLRCDTSDPLACSALLCHYYFISSNLEKYTLAASTYFDPEDTFHLVNALLSGIIMQLPEEDLEVLANGLNDCNPFMIEALLTASLPEFPDKFADIGSLEEAQYITFNVLPILDSFPVIATTLSKYKQSVN